MQKAAGNVINRGKPRPSRMQILQVGARRKMFFRSACAITKTVIVRQALLVLETGGGKKRVLFVWFLTLLCLICRGDFNRTSDGEPLVKWLRSFTSRKCSGRTWRPYCKSLPFLRSAHALACGSRKGRGGPIEQPGTLCNNLCNGSFFGQSKNYWHLDEAPACTTKKRLLQKRLRKSRRPTFWLSEELIGGQRLVLGRKHWTLVTTEEVRCLWRWTGGGLFYIIGPPLSFLRYSSLRVCTYIYQDIYLDILLSGPGCGC